MRKFLATRKPSAKVRPQENRILPFMKLRSFVFSLALCLPLCERSSRAVTDAEALARPPESSHSPETVAFSRLEALALAQVVPLNRTVALRRSHQHHPDHPHPHPRRNRPHLRRNSRRPQNLHRPPKPSPTPKPTPALKPDAELDNVADEFIRGYLAARPLHATALGFHEYDGRISEYTRLAIDAELARLTRFDDRLKKFDLAKLGPRAAIDLRLLQTAIKKRAFSDAGPGHLRAQPDELRQRYRR